MEVLPIKVDPDFVPASESGKIKVDKTKPETISQLASYIETCYDVAKRAKDEVGINNRLEKCMRQYKGEYEPEIASAISKEGGSDVYRKITTLKCDTLGAWITDVMNPIDSKPWALRPTPMPDIPPDILENITATAEQAVIDQFAPMLMAGEPVDGLDMETFAYETASNQRSVILREANDIAEKRAKQMELVMEDQLLEGGWRNAFREFTSDYTIFPNAILKGPIIRKEPELSWEKSPSGQVTAETKIASKLQFERVSPFDIFPGPSSKGIQDSYLIELIRFTRSELVALRGLPNYKTSEINKILAMKSSEIEDKTDENTETTKNSLENRQDRPDENESDDKIEALSFWGSVPGHMLEEWGMTVTDRLAEYEISAIKIKDHVIKAIINEHPLGHRPYSMDCFKKVPGAFWGIGLPEMMDDVQRICNSSIRSLCNNFAVSSGPQVAIDISQLAPGQDITDVRPRKIWQYDGKQAPNNRKFIEFVQPDNNAQPLLYTYSKMKQEGDDVTGIPSFAGGEAQMGGAAETASGLAMLQGNFTKAVKKIVVEMGLSIYGTVLERLYVWNMLHNEDEEIKGDVKIDVRGPLEVLAKEQIQSKMLELMQMSNNPVDQQIIGLEERRNLWERIAGRMNIPIEDIVPPEDKFKDTLLAQQEAQALQMMQGVPPEQQQVGA